jgi:hypothetical protein
MTTENPTPEDDDAEVEPTPADGAEASDDAEPEGDSFPREYVERLRREAAGYRDRAKQADKLAARLHTALVAATGRLADPSDLAFDEAHLADETALGAAIDALLTSKPHLATRRPSGDIGQGARTSSEPVSLGALLRARA